MNDIIEKLQELFEEFWGIISGFGAGMIITTFLKLWLIPYNISYHIEFYLFLIGCFLLILPAVYFCWIKNI